MRTEAYLSPCRKYRYWLLRIWDETQPALCVIGVNPSTADENSDDPTIRKVIGFAKRLGLGGILMLNVGAYRATDPREWKRAADPFGPENSLSNIQDYILRFAPGMTVAAWGKNCSSGRAELRATQIKRGIIGLQCWGKNNDGTPRHPLMLSYETPLEML